MGRPSIGAVYNQAISQLNVVSRYLSKSKLLPPDLQGFVAEIMMLRIFGILEYTVRETALRLACGVAYRNGVVPTNIICKCSSLNDAIQNFKTLNRAKPKGNLQFTNVSNTNDAIKFVIGTSEAFRLKLSIYGTQFEEMRKVRNHIAHRNSSTHLNYKDVIKQRYGAYLKLKPSIFLISTKRQALPIIEEYMKVVRIIVSDITTT